LTGDKWRAHRKLIAPTFHLNVLKSFVTLFNVNSRDTVSKLRKMGSSTFDIHDFMSECTVEILLGKSDVLEAICNTLMLFYTVIDYLSVTYFTNPLHLFYRYRDRYGSEQENSKEKWF